MEACTIWLDAAVAAIARHRGSLEVPRNRSPLNMA
jgi:hypothetical protein